MPEFEVAKPQVAEENEFTPGRQNPVVTRPSSGIASKSRNARPDEVKGDITHHAHLKRGRLPHTGTIRSTVDSEAKIMGETSEHNSVFSDALSQKLSSQAQALDKHDKHSREQGAAVRKTTRVLDEHHQEIAKPPSPLLENNPQKRLTKAWASNRQAAPAQHPNRQESSSQFKKNEKHDKVSYGQCDVSEDSPRDRCRGKKKTVLGRLWHILTRCFTNPSCAYRDKQSPKKSIKKNGSEQCHRQDGRNKIESEHKNINSSRREKHLRKNSTKK